MKRIITYSLVLVVLIVGYVVISHLPQKEEQNANYSTYDVEKSKATDEISNDTGQVLLNVPSPTRVEYNDIAFEIVDGIWQMTSPYNHTVKGTELKGALLDNLYIEAVNTVDKSKADCGLEPPQGYLSTWDANETQTTIYFGKREGGLIYAMREGSNDIYQIPPPVFLDKDPISYLNTLIYVKSIDDVNTIKVNDVVFEISNGIYKKDGVSIDKATFIDFYKKLMGMTLIGEANEPSKDTPILKMVVSFKDGTADNVEVYEYKERYGAVFINNECTFYTMRESAEEILALANEMH